jgi:hypothetical protein
MFENFSREQLRLAYSQAWTKHLARLPLTPLEALICEAIGAHPEYQEVIGDTDAALSFEQPATGAAENPFLHLGLHLAVREQLSIDRPPGVRDLHRQLQSFHGDAHGAEHALMEALAEALWQAQRSGRAPDETGYLGLVRERLARQLAATRKG